MLCINFGRGMSDGSEKRPLPKILWSVSIKTRTFAAVNTCYGSFKSCLKLLKQYRTIEQMCSDAHSITLRFFKSTILSIYILYSPILSLPSYVLKSNTLFGQRLNESTSKSYLCCSAAFKE